MAPGVYLRFSRMQVAYRSTTLLLIFFAALSGCALDKPHRPYPENSSQPGSSLVTPPPEECTSVCSNPADPREEPSCKITCSGTSPAENHRFENFSSNHVSLAKGNYLVGYVEFDDQGWFHDKRQRNVIFDAIANDREAYRKQTKKDRQYLVTVFAHGWKHNASGSDQNVKEFNKLLERLDVQEQLLSRKENRDARKVVGIYLAWRGASLKIPLLEDLTFWNRKNAGERVGDRSAKQFLMEINNLRANLNGWKESDNLASSSQTQLILIGHSFGGLLMYHALHTELMDRELHVELKKDGKFGFDTAKSFGDFILLVNPAFEGSAYEPLFEAAKSRCFPGQERPIMAIVTSKSDWATGIAFPLGRLYTLTQTAPHEGERATIMHTVGHLDRYITHDITYDPQDQSVPIEHTKKLSPTTNTQTLANAQEQAKSPETTGKLQERYDGVRLDPRPIYTDHFPYLVMSADKTLIKGHSDIWNDRFIQFVTAFVAKEVMSKKPESGGKQTQLPALYRFWLEDSDHCPPGMRMQKQL